MKNTYVKKISTGDLFDVNSCKFYKDCVEYLDYTEFGEDEIISNDDWIYFEEDVVVSNMTREEYQKYEKERYEKISKIEKDVNRLYPIPDYHYDTLMIPRKQFGRYNSFEHDIRRYMMDSINKPENITINGIEYDVDIIIKHFQDCERIRNIRKNEIESRLKE